jgi:hypothetical protein
VGGEAPRWYPSFSIHFETNAVMIAAMMRCDDKCVLTIPTTIPHSEFGASDCCGCLNGVCRDWVGAVRCNQCGETLRLVPAADLEKTIHPMELALLVTSAICSHCGAVNPHPRVSAMLAFVCSECGESATVQAS